MAWHRTIVSLLIATTTVLALLYVSTFSPESPAGQPAPGFGLETLPASQQPTGTPDRSRAPRYPEQRSALA
jgi:hypothetical protein